MVWVLGSFDGGRKSLHSSTATRLSSEVQSMVCPLSSMTYSPSVCSIHRPATGVPGARILKNTQAVMDLKHSGPFSLILIKLHFNGDFQYKSQFSPGLTFERRVGLVMWKEESWVGNVERGEWGH